MTLSEEEKQALKNPEWRKYGWELLNFSEVGDRDRYRCLYCGKMEWFADTYSYCQCRKEKTE